MSKLYKLKPLVFEWDSFHSAFLAEVPLLGFYVKEELESWEVSIGVWAYAPSEFSRHSTKEDAITAANAEFHRMVKQFLEPEGDCFRFKELEWKEIDGGTALESGDCPDTYLIDTSEEDWFPLYQEICPEGGGFGVRGFPSLEEAKAGAKASRENLINQWCEEVTL